MLGDVVETFLLETPERPSIVEVAASFAVYGVAVWVHLGNGVRLVNRLSEIPIVAWLGGRLAGFSLFVDCADISENVVDGDAGRFPPFRLFIRLDFVDFTFSFPLFLPAASWPYIAVGCVESMCFAG